MDRYDEYLSIAELIHKSHTGTLGAAEQARLEEWAAENRDLYGRLIQDRTIAGRMTTMDAIDVKENLRVFHGLRKSGLRRTRRKTLIRVAKVAAVLVPVIAAAVLLINKPVDEPLAENRFEHAKKAVLVLDDGQTVDLSEAPMLTGTDAIESVGEAEISYSKTNTDEARTNTVIIPRGASYVVNLSDGTVVNINSDSKLSYKTSFTGDVREVYLEGEAYFTVAKSEKPFIVNTSLGQVRVYGTEFNVRHYSDENAIRATLVNGSVAYSNDRVGEIMLEPSQQLTYTSGADAVELKEVDTEVYTAWKDDVIYFKDQTLYEIMLNLSRRYDLRFSFADEALKTRRMSGRLGRYEGFDSFVRIFSVYDDIEFNIEGNNVTIAKR